MQGIVNNRNYRVDGKYGHGPMYRNPEHNDWEVYSLEDERDSVPFYVGATTKDLARAWEQIRDTFEYYLTDPMPAQFNDPRSRALYEYFDAKTDDDPLFLDHVRAVHRAHANTNPVGLRNLKEFWKRHLHTLVVPDARANHIRPRREEEEFIPRDLDELDQELLDELPPEHVLDYELLPPLPHEIVDYELLPPLPGEEVDYSLMPPRPPFGPMPRPRRPRRRVAVPRRYRPAVAAAPVRRRRR